MPLLASNVVPSPHRHRSLAIPFECEEQIAVGQDPADTTKAVLADNTNFIGFVSRPVKNDAPDPATVGGVWPGRDNIPIRTGYEVGVEPAHDVIEREGPLYLWLTGTGLIALATPKQSLLEWFEGRLRLVQATRQGAYLLEEVFTGPSGALRVRARRIS